MIRFDDIGHRLKAFRLGSGLSAEEIARKLGISRTALYRFEKGEVAKIETLEKLAELLQVSVPTLLGVGVEYVATFAPFTFSRSRFSSSVTRLPSSASAAAIIRAGTSSSPISSKKSAIAICSLANLLTR